MSQLASDAKISSAMAALGMTAPLPNLDDSQVLKAILVALGNVVPGGGGGGTGNVVGPASSINGDLAVFSGTTGKHIADGSALTAKLNGIEAGADVTDTANVAAAGALMATDLGAGVETALGVNLGSAGSVLVTDYAADAGSTDAYAATLNPAPAALVVGAHYRFMANTANTGAATINFNGLGAKTIVKAAGGITTALADNDIRAGQWVDVVYDGTNMQMQSTLGNTPSSGGGGDDFFFIGAAEMIPCVTSGPGINSSETSTNKVNYDSLDFDPGTVQYAQATRAWPTGWNTATAKFLWTADSGSGDVVFGAQARCIVNDDPIDSAFGTAQTCTDTLTAAGDDDISPATSAFTPAGTVADGAFTRFQFYRDASSGSDTLSTNARLLGVLISKAS